MTPEELCRQLLLLAVQHGFVEAKQSLSELTEDDLIEMRELVNDYATDCVCKVLDETGCEITSRSRSTAILNKR